MRFDRFKTYLKPIKTQNYKIYWNKYISFLIKQQKLY